MWRFTKRRALERPCHSNICCSDRGPAGGVALKAPQDTGPGGQKKKKKKEAVPLSISSVPCADVPAVDMPAASQSRKCRTSCDWTRKTGEQASCVCCNNYGAYAGWWHHGFEPKHFHYLIEAKHMILFVTISVNVHYLVITIHSVKEKKIFIVILPADVFRNTEMGKIGSSR